MDIDMATVTYGDIFMTEAKAANDPLARESAIIQELRKRQHWLDKDYAFVVSAKAAMRDRPKAALPVILSELQQHLDTPTWHPVHWRTLTHEQKKNVLRSKVFMKDKYTASGAFDKYKARLVS